MICTFDLTNKMIYNLGQHYHRLKGRSWGETEGNMEKEPIAEAGAGSKIAQDDSHFWFVFKRLLTCFFLVRRHSTLTPSTSCQASPVASGMPRYFTVDYGAKSSIDYILPICGALSPCYFSPQQWKLADTKSKASGDLSKLLYFCVGGGGRPHRQH